MIRPHWLLPLAIPLAAPLRAQDLAGPPIPLDPIVISATRTPIEAAKTGSSVTVITATDIDRLPAPTVANTLDQAPGVAFALRGPAGGSSEFSLRGFSQEDVVVRVDGIELADPGELRTQADMGQFLTFDIDRIEVLKGPQSALYGGEAVGGVIDITTGPGRIDGSEVRGFAETGSYGTFRGGLGYSLGSDTWDVSLSAQGIRTEGFSAADENAGNSEADGYDNVTVAAVGSLDVTDAVTIGGALRYFDRTSEIDTISGGVPVDATGFSASSRLFAGRAFVGFDMLEGRATNELSVQYLDSSRTFREGVISRFEGERWKLEYLGTYAVSPAIDLVYGADWTTEDVSTTDAVEADSTIAGAYLQAIAQLSERLTVTAAGRYDGHSEFGGLPTWRATAAFAPRDGTVLRAAVGTGFRAPSNRELFTPASPFFGPIGNPDLEPEETVGWEVGIDQAFLDGDAQITATLFESRTDQLIQFVFGEGYVQVPGESQRRGLEVGLSAALTPQLNATAQYTYLDSRDAEGERLEFVPLNDAGVTLDYWPTERFGIAVSGTYVGGVMDSGVTLDDFVVVDGAARYLIGDDTEAYLRVENLFDAEYQRIDGFGTSDLAIYAGLRTTF